MSPILPPKKDVALALLERASVFVHLDPRKDDVVVPAWLKQQPQLVLQIGLNMAVKIPDLEVQEEAVSCTLSFSRRPHFCYVPWGAVYALVGEDGRGMVWPEDIPAEVAAQTQAANRRGSLRALSPEGADAGSSGEAPRHAGKSQRSQSSRPSGGNLVAIEGELGDGTPVLDPLGPVVDSEEARVAPEPLQPDEAFNESAKLRPSERPYLRLVK